MVDRALGLAWKVDLAILQALDQVGGREVDQFDVVGAVDDGIWHGLADTDARDAGDDVVQALDMLNVQGCVDVDPGPEQFLDVRITQSAPSNRYNVTRWAL